MVGSAGCELDLRIWTKTVVLCLTNTTKQESAGGAEIFCKKRTTHPRKPLESSTNIASSSRKVGMRHRYIPISRNLMIAPSIPWYKTPVARFRSDALHRWAEIQPDFVRVIKKTPVTFLSTATSVYMVPRQFFF